MEFLKKTALPIFVTGIWINISETIRWILLLEPAWLEKYQELGIGFPNEMVNMITWMIWGFCYATVIFAISRKFTLLQTTLLAWFAAFIMMWMIVWNVGVLPTKMLWYNIPLSLLEALIAAYICKRFLKKAA